jgi:hypothetical protein
MTLGLKILLCLLAATSALLSIMMKTFDDTEGKRKLTRNGKRSIICFAITFAVGVANESVNLYKENLSKATRIEANKQTDIVQGKLDQAILNGNHLEELTQGYMLKADNAEKELQTVRGQLESIGVQISDPTIKKLIGEVKNGIKIDTASTGNRLVELTTLMNDVHGDLNAVNSSIINIGEVIHNTKNQIDGMKTDINVIKSDLLTVRMDLVSTKSFVQELKPPRVMVHTEDSGIDGSVDAGD